MISRFMNNRLADSLQNGLSFLLLGPRQTGKTTLVTEVMSSAPYLAWNLMETRERQKFEKDPSLIIREAEAAGVDRFFIDEVQKVPALLDDIQTLIDRTKKVFALTGSSARKLRREHANLLPGRTLSFRLDPLFTSEYRAAFGLDSSERLKSVLRFGELPKAFLLAAEGRARLAEEWLYSYVSTYLEEEVRAEAIVRKIGIFSRFLKLAAEESGRIVNLRSMSQDIGVPHSTVGAYYRILEDCLIAERIEPLVPAGMRGKVSKAAKYLFFDLGVLNAAAETLGSGDYPAEHWGRLFEQWVGLTLLRSMRAAGIHGALHYWRDYSGREVDWVLEIDGEWIPIEVKWGDNLKSGALRHLHYFVETYPDKVRRGYVVFGGTRSRRIDDIVTAITPGELLDRCLPGRFA